MKMFQPDPVAALDRTRAKLANVDENLASLRAKRAEVLLSTEDASAVVAVDKAIDIEQANAKIYEDRIAALEEACRRDKFNAREAERKKAIAAIGKRLQERVEIAEEYESLLRRTAEMYQRLMSCESVDGLWPFGGMPSTYIRTPDLWRELGWGLYGLLPEGHNKGLGVTGVMPVGVAGAVKAQNEAILARLSYAPIHPKEEDSAA